MKSNLKLLSTRPQESLKNLQLKFKKWRC